MQDSNKRELDKIKELSREYRAKGYRVVMEPGNKELPDFMKNLNFHPDLIVYGEDQSLVIEVKTSRSIGSTKDFTHIADHVRKQEGWDFVLVLTNPPFGSVIEEAGSLPGYAHVKNQLREAETLLHSGKRGQFYNAAMLIAWAGLEAALRHSMSALYQKTKPVTPQTLIRDSAMYGVISRGDATVIEAAMKTRNALAHGYEGVKTTAIEIKKIITIGQRVLDETNQLAPHLGLHQMPQK